jgi:hypothetical protein
MSFTVPQSWGELSQEALRHILRLLWLYGDTAHWELRVQVAAFLYFTGVEVVRRADLGWLCRERASGKTFLLDPELLPSLMKSVEWTCHTEEMGVRLEQVGKYKAVDYALYGLPFGNYLKVENLYQSYLLSKEDECLVKMARLLYAVPDEDDGAELRDEVLMGVFLWYAGAKQLLGRRFPNFLKPADGEAAAVTQETLLESMRAQIRLLTKGDVTKQKYILEETDTWTALAELDALAREADEIQKKYGK